MCVVVEVSIEVRNLLAWHSSLKSGQTDEGANILYDLVCFCS